MIEVVDDVPVCRSPYLEFKKGDCCLDENSDDICDDDKEVVQQPNDLDEAVQAAKLFAVYWERKDHASLYDLFTPKLKENVTKEQFVSIFEYFELDAVLTMRYEDVVFDEEGAFAHFIIAGEGFDEKMPAFAMEMHNGSWTFNAFSNYFEDAGLISLCKKPHRDTNDCILNMSLVLDDSELCYYLDLGSRFENYPDRDIMTECLGNFNKLYGREEIKTFCNMTTERDDDEYYCLLSFDAMVTSSLCEEAPAKYPFLKDRCLVKMAEKTGKIELCEPIISSRSKAECIGHVAKHTKDFSLCEGIYEFKDRRVCADVYSED